MTLGTACYLRSEGKTLFLYRNAGNADIHNAKYVPPGGKTNRGEKGIDCDVREFKEETGLTLLNPKLRIIATFYNQGRIMGGKENPEDWQVEVYEASEYSGILMPEHQKNAEPLWVQDSDLSRIPMHEGDRKLMELLKEEGVYEALFQYEIEKLIRFEHVRVG